MAIEFDLIAAISETTKITALLLASITFILNQYLKEHENHAPCRRLILYIIPIIFTVGITMMFSIINIIELTKLTDLVAYYKNYYYIIAFSPMLPAACLFIILLFNLPSW